MVSVAPVLDRYGAFMACLGGPADCSNGWQALRRAVTTGPPLGSAGWVAAIETQTRPTLAPQKRGPKLRESGWRIILCI